MTSAPSSTIDQPRLGIAFILLGMSAISVQDMLIKQLSGDYPLHQIVFVRSVVGIVFSFALLWWEGGLTVLKTRTPGLHVLRALLVVVANMTYFAALAVMPLADATALFFVAPLFITLLSIPLLGERVGPRRVAAVVAGFVGVVLMLGPGLRDDDAGPAIATALLPLVAAFAYALMQMLTRRLGVTAKASAMAIYIQGAFILVGIAFYLVAGDGRYARDTDSQSVQFLLRAWQWPVGNDAYLFLGCGVAAGFIAYSLSQAYRIAAAATVAPFEYIALPLAVLWGWLIWNELPGPWVTAGIILIMGAGVYVFLRERERGRPVSSKRPFRRW